MQIASAEWVPFRLPFATTFATAQGTQAWRAGLLLRLTDSDGLIGLGEATPTPTFGAGTLADAWRVAVALLPRLHGLDLRAADELLASLDYTQPGVTAVASGLDMALCDLHARHAGMSVAAWLGGDPQRPVPVNALIGANDTSTAIAQACSAVAAGYSCVKLKVGVCTTAQAEIERIASVRAALGQTPRLRLDANGAWGVAEAIAIIGAAERYDLELVEQPVAPADLAGMARVRAALHTPIAADEPVGRPDQAQQVIAAQAADLLVIKPMLAGGLRPAQQIMAMAQAAGLGAFVTTTIDAGVGVAAALHLAATLPTPLRACGLATGPLLAADLLEQPLRVAEGLMRVPAQLGLGICLDAAQLARWGFTIRDE